MVSPKVVGKLITELKDIPVALRKKLTAMGIDPLAARIMKVAKNKFVLTGIAIGGAVQEAQWSENMKRDIENNGYEEGDQVQFDDKGNVVWNPSKAKPPKSQKDMTQDELDALKFSANDEMSLGAFFNAADISSDGIVMFKDPTAKVDGLFQRYIYAAPAEKKGGQPWENTVVADRLDNVVNRYYSSLIARNGGGEVGARALSKMLGLKETTEASKIRPALESQVKKYTYDQTAAFKYQGQKKLLNFEDWIKTAPKESPIKSYTEVKPTIWDPSLVTRVANTVSQKFTGMNLPETDMKKIIKQLQAEQKKNPQKNIITENTETNNRTVVTQTGLDEEQFLIDKIAGTDAAKHKQVLDMYSAFKQWIGAR